MYFRNVACVTLSGMSFEQTFNMAPSVKHYSSRELSSLLKYCGLLIYNVPGQKSFKSSTVKFLTAYKNSHRWLYASPFNSRYFRLQFYGIDPKLVGPILGKRFKRWSLSTKQIRVYRVCSSLPGIVELGGDCALKTNLWVDRKTVIWQRRFNKQLTFGQHRMNTTTKISRM